MLVAVLLAACATSGPSEGPAPSGTEPLGPTTVTLLTHDSFAVSEQLLKDFEARTGITVKVVSAGDAGEVVNKAVLTAGNPEGDVLFGVDNTLLTRAVDAGVFTPYRSPALASLRPELRDDTADGQLTPVDYGDVCVNIDDTWFADHHMAPPRGIDDLTKPALQGPARRREPGHLLAGPGVPARHGGAVRHRRLAAVLGGAAQPTA